MVILRLSVPPCRKNAMNFTCIMRIEALPSASCAVRITAVQSDNPSVFGARFADADARFG
ncbi:hypothetical protein REMIM1_PF00711 (plasmid) [Rhizobium etli bv. mimosae str. Mim1]|nr:hypothetical protein REMIM1_PF00711 [Rhizobium etli bv. mimosae str. Mim1]